jgi:hypothetical protein
MSKMSKEEMTRTIQDSLVHGTLNISRLAETSGWIYQSIRSKANTIAKRLNGKVAPAKRGVWILVTNDQPEIPSIEEPSPEAVEE